MSLEIPADVKQQLLNDPAVQEQLRAAGKDAVAALNDPKVQQQIIDTCKEKFPQYYESAKDNITHFVNDPAVQAKAKEYASVAAAYVLQAGGLFVAQIQQGPAGVRLLSFAGGLASSANAVMSLINPLGLVFGPVTYVLATYQLIFSLTTILFEAKPEWIQQVSGLSSYQDMLIDKAKFLSQTDGRGLFYIFQGTLWLCFASLTEVFDLVSGLWMVFVGALNLLIHFGGYSAFAEKVAGGYQALAQQGAPPAAGP